MVEAVSLERLSALVRQSSSLLQVLVALGLPSQGRAHNELKKRIEALGLDTSHMSGQAWARGQTKHTNASVARIATANAKSDEELFSRNSNTINDGPRLIQRLLELGWSYECAHCGI